MTAHALAQVFLLGPDVPVTVAGHGRLSFVTHGATQTGDRVVVIYVAEPEPEELVLTSPPAGSFS